MNLVLGRIRQGSHGLDNPCRTRVDDLFHFTTRIECLFYAPTACRRQTANGRFRGGGNDEKVPQFSIQHLPSHDHEGGADGCRGRRHGPVLRAVEAQQGLCARAKPIKLGLTCDASGQYGNSGQDDLRGIRMAIDEFNAKGGVLGRKIEWITADTETTPATGTRVAERFITREDCAILIGALHSGVANAITQVANKYGTIYLNTNSSAPSEAGENCSRVKFVWDGNGTNFSKAAVKQRGRRHRQELAAADQRLRLGPHDLGGDQDAGRGGRRQDRRQPAGAAEHPRLHLVPAEDPADQARRGRDRDRRRRHQGAARAGRAAEARRASRPGSTTSRTGRTSGARRRACSACSAPPGITSCRCRASPSSSRSGRMADPDGPIPVPGNVSYNGYMATRELLRAIERAGSTNNIKIIKELESLKMSGGRPHAALRRLHGSGHASDAADDLSRAQERASRRTTPTTTRSSPGPSRRTAADDAAPAKCKLVPYEQVPTVDA